MMLRSSVAFSISLRIDRNVSRSASVCFDAGLSGADQTRVAARIPHRIITGILSAKLDRDDWAKGPSELFGMATKG